MSMRMVWVTFDIIGFHVFKGAPQEVNYLADTHRHKFGFKVTMEVSHDNREVEFHTLQRDCLKILRANTNIYDSELDEYIFKSASCEMIADVLLTELLKVKNYFMITSDGVSHPRQIIIEVSEDGECGGIVYRFPMPFGSR